MNRISINDAQLHVVTRGSGQPLLLVHGFPLDHQMWQGQIADLADDFQVIAPDLRGLGNSSDAPHTMLMEDYADDLAHLLDQLAIRDPIVFCGLSMGGYIAWQFWRRYAQRLSHLILCDTRAAADTEEAARGRRALAERVLAEGTSSLVETMVPKLFASRTLRQNPAVVTATEQVMRSARPSGVAAAARGMSRRVDATPWLPEIKLPTLLVCGQEDALTGVPEMQSLADAMQQAELAIIPRCGHMAPLEDPIHVNKAIRGFLGVPGRGV